MKWIALLLIAASSSQAQKTKFPRVVRMYVVLDPVQAKYAGNEHVKPCGPNGPTDGSMACYDPKMRHIINHLYSKKETCESWEGVACTDDGQFFAPIGKPVFEDRTDQ